MLAPEYGLYSSFVGVFIYCVSCQILSTLYCSLICPYFSSSLRLRMLVLDLLPSCLWRLHLSSGTFKLITQTLVGQTRKLLRPLPSFAGSLYWESVSCELVGLWSSYRTCKFETLYPRLADPLGTSAPAVAGFMTGSAITIVSGQVPGLLGIASRFE